MCGRHQGPMLAGYEGGQSLLRNFSPLRSNGDFEVIRDNPNDQRTLGAPPQYGEMEAWSTSPAGTTKRQ